MTKQILAKRIFKAVLKDEPHTEAELEVTLFRPEPFEFAMATSLSWQVAIQCRGIETLDLTGPGIDEFQALETAMTIASATILKCTEKYHLSVRVDGHPMKVIPTSISSVSDLSSVSLIASLMAASGSSKH